MEHRPFPECYIRIITMRVWIPWSWWIVQGPKSTSHKKSLVPADLDIPFPCGGGFGMYPSSGPLLGVSPRCEVPPGSAQLCHPGWGLHPLPLGTGIISEGQELARCLSQPVCFAKSANFFFGSRNDRHPCEIVRKKGTARKRSKMPQVRKGV